MKIFIRSVEDADHPFIFATFIRHNWFRKDNKTTLKRSTWSALTHKHVEKILAESDVLVACLDDEPDHIVGYALRDGDTVFSYVKLEWRQYNPSIKEMLLKEFQ